MPEKGGVTIRYGNAALVTLYNPGSAAMTYDDMARKALTAFGYCALTDYGSVSGTYTDDFGQTTCYL